MMARAAIAAALASAALVSGASSAQAARAVDPLALEVALQRWHDMPQHWQARQCDRKRPAKLARRHGLPRAERRELRRAYAAILRDC